MYLPLYLSESNSVTLYIYDVASFRKTGHILSLAVITNWYQTRCSTQVAQVLKGQEPASRAQDGVTFPCLCQKIHLPATKCETKCDFLHFSFRVKCIQINHMQPSWQPSSVSSTLKTKKHFYNNETGLNQPRIGSFPMCSLHRDLIGAFAFYKYVAIILLRYLRLITPMLHSNPCADSRSQARRQCHSPSLCYGSCLCSTCLSKQV